MILLGVKRSLHLDERLTRNFFCRDHMPESEEFAVTISTSEEPEGLEQTASSGWGEYPLDSVFVRTEQRTVGEVVRRIRAGRYDLNPEFQRDFLWPVDKQSRLIESCLMRIPLPVFYVAEAKDGKIIVVDGLQRLSTFKRFLDNEFKLHLPNTDDETDTPNPLSGNYFSDLKLNLQERIEDTQLTLYVLDSKAPERAKLDIFERVNSGEPLTRQQMRNCLYNGPATRWLKKASSSPAFLQATGQSLDSNKMRDREAINRFCAFSLLGWQEYIRGDMDSFLADGLIRMNQLRDEELVKMAARFERSMTNNSKLFGKHAFRKSLHAPNGPRSVLNIALFDVCSTLLARFTPDDLSRFQSELANAIKGLTLDDTFRHAITYSTNSTRQVRTRFKMMEQTIHEAVQ
jgi:hypothetical protein